MVEIFNSKGLTGWEGHDKYWSVKDSVIIGKNKDEVKVSAYLRRNGNSATHSVRGKLVSRRCTPASPCGDASPRSSATPTPTPATW
jgi:hypothetical protein